MKIAYLVLAHRYPDQLLRLIDRLDTSSATFLLHIDKKEGETYTYLKEKLGNRGNVHFLKRYTCYWAGFGIVQATFQGIKEAVEKKIDFDYLALLSGQDYPIKTNHYINQFLEDHEGKSFIHHNALPYHQWNNQNGGWDRIQRWHFIKQNQHRIFPLRNRFRSIPVIRSLWNKADDIGLFKRKFPSGMKPYGGAQFWCLHKTHAKYMYDFVQANPSYFRFFRYVFVPDEILFQTIMANSGYKDQIVSDTLTFLEWHRPGAVLVTADMQNIKSTYYLFARKFDDTIDPEICNLIDQEILGIE
jgi:hypothetical protein